MKHVIARAARALSFSHLAGIGASAGKPKSEDDDDKKGDDEEKTSKRAEGDDDQEQQDREDGDAKKGKKAEGDDQPEDEEEDKEDGAKKSKKSKKADDSGESEDEEAENDDGDEEMRGNSTAAKARRRERARCAAIFASRAAARNPVLAANLAFKTRMTRREAIATLESTPAPASSTHDARGLRNPNIGPGGDSNTRNSSQATAAGWEKAMESTGGKRRQ